MINEKNNFLQYIYMDIKNSIVKKFALKIKQRKIYLHTYFKIKNKFKKSSSLKYYLDFLAKLKIFKYYRSKGYKFVKYIGFIFDLTFTKMPDTKDAYKHLKNISRLKKNIYIARLFKTYSISKVIFTKLTKVARYSKKIYKVGKIKSLSFKEPTIKSLLRFKLKFLSIIYLDFETIVPIYLFQKISQFKSNQLKNFSYYNFFLHHSKRLYKEIMFNLYWTILSCFKYKFNSTNVIITQYKSIYFKLFNLEFIIKYNNIFINKNLDFFKFNIYSSIDKSFNLIKFDFNNLLLNFVKLYNSLKYNNKRKTYLGVVKTKYLDNFNYLGKIKLISKLLKLFKTNVYKFPNCLKFLKAYNAIVIYCAKFKSLRNPNLFGKINKTLRLKLLKINFIDSKTLT